MEGNCRRVNFSTPQRDTHFNVDVNIVPDWYDALRKFIEIVYKEAVHFKNNEGDVLCFNNIRLLHGRTGYDDTDTNVRQLIGAFIDWDIIYSKLRVLKNAKYN